MDDSEEIPILSSVVYSESEYRAVEKDDEHRKQWKVFGQRPSKPSIWGTLSTYRVQNIAFGIMFISLLIIIVTISRYDSKDSGSMKYNISPSSSPTNSIVYNTEGGNIHLLAANEYGPMNILNYTWFTSVDGSNEFPLLVEPYRSTYISIHESAIEIVCSYALEVSSADPANDNSWTIDSTEDTGIALTMTSVGSYALTTIKICIHDIIDNVIGQKEAKSSHTTVTKYTNLLYVRYVRRELRSLTDADREDFLDALKTLYDVDTVTGQSRYGSSYKSLYYFVSIHVDGAGNPVCDEFHTGEGFFSNHVLLSNYLEQSLQLINPRISLPYLEYVRDFSSDSYSNHLNNQLDGGEWSDLFSDLYFGASDPETGLILNGRWEGVTLPYTDSSFYTNHGVSRDHTFYPSEEDAWLSLSGDQAHLHSPWGILRSPWNYNPSPYITRFMNEALVPTLTESDVTDWVVGTKCDDLTSFLSSTVIGQSLHSFLFSLKSIHTKLHDGIGGQGGPMTSSIDAQLQQLFVSRGSSLSAEDFVVLVELSSKFYKTYIPYKNFYSSSKYPVYPLNCTNDPWTGSEIGSTSVTCECVSYYTATLANANTFLQLYFDKFTQSSIYPLQYQTYNMLNTLSFLYKKQAVSLLCQRMPYDGDMVGSSSAADPIFWVSHGSLEKMFHRLVLNGAFTDMTYSSTSTCSGHAATGTKAWLDGYNLMNADIDSTSLTNIDFADMLNPLSSSYFESIPYVYDGQLMGCDDVDVMLS